MSNPGSPTGEGGAGTPDVPAPGTSEPPSQPPGNEPAWGQWGNQQPTGGEPAWGQQPTGGEPAWGQQAPGYLPYAPPLPATSTGGYGPGATPGMYQDLPSGLFLPEGTRLASSARRIGAWFLAIPLSVVTLGIGYIVWGAIVWGRGQTPALQVLGMRCWRPETSRVAGWWWMALREIIGGFVEGLFGLITEAISFILMLSTRERRCLHDMIAGTVVLHDPEKRLK